MRDFRERLISGSPVLLDGATGTELIRRGYRPPPLLWSAEALLSAPDLVLAIHLDYVAAGAEVVTANTFRTCRWTLARAGLAHRAGEMAALAVHLAHEAGARWVAGSIAPLEDCYRPDLVLPSDVLAAEHADTARNLADAGCDLLLVETMNTVTEADAATRAAALTGLPVLTAFVCGPDGRLLSGESPEDAARAATKAGASAVLVNCAPVATIPVVLRTLRRGTTLPLGAHANVMSEATTPGDYASAADGWMGLGARIVGGCCGTTPAYIAALART